MYKGKLLDKRDFEIVKEKILIRNRISSNTVVTQHKISSTFSGNGVGLLGGFLFRTLSAVGLTGTFGRAKVIYNFLHHCKDIKDRQGTKGLILRLKAMSVLLMKYTGGDILHDTSDLKCRVSRTQAGLLRIIPSSDRILIRSGDLRVTKFWLSLFGVYGDLLMEGNPKLNTITDGFQGNREHEVYDKIINTYAPVFAKMLHSLAMKHKVRALNERTPELEPIIKSAPGTGGSTVSTHPWIILLQAGMLKAEGLASFYEGVAARMRPNKTLNHMLKLIQAIPLNLIPSLKIEAGRLGFKDEAAGKVRVFAMVDAPTQWLLKPLHDLMFDLLRSIMNDSKLGMDATFDQTRDLATLSGQLHGKSGVWSFDLSAATDRLPMDIQVALLANLVSPELAVNWAGLLIGRGYTAFTNKYGGIHKTLFYGVGQPMGALSSWGSLGLNHHMIVQIAAWEAGVVPVGTWFTKYKVLGDDIIIYDPLVAAKYLEIMSILGVGVGLAKSVSSPQGLAFEFAKKLFSKGFDCSPIRLKEFVMANLMVHDAISWARKYKLTFPQLIKALGYGNKVLSGLSRPVGQLNSRVRALHFAYILPRTEEELQDLLMSGQKTGVLRTTEFRDLVSKLVQYMFAVLVPRIEKLIDKRERPVTVINSRTKLVTELLAERFYLRGLLQKLQTPVPNSSFPIVPDPFSTDVEEVGPPKDFQLFPNENSVFVSTQTFDIVLEFLTKGKDVALQITQSMIGKEATTFTEDLKKVLSQLKVLEGMAKTPDVNTLDLYREFLRTIRLVAAVQWDYAQIERIPEVLHVGRLDPETIKLWKILTVIILQVADPSYQIGKWTAAPKVDVSKYYPPGFVNVFPGVSADDIGQMFKDMKLNEFKNVKTYHFNKEQPPKSGVPVPPGDKG